MTLFPKPPRIALVVSTHGTPAYVHLHLETAKRLYPHVPVMVHDDASDRRPELLDLCHKYHATWYCPPERRGHYHGDLAALVAGLDWASRDGADLLVKMSRRWLPLTDWTGQIAGLATEYQSPTYSGLCADSRFLFRTECMALYVPSWLAVVEELFDVAVRRQDIGVLEAYLFDVAKRVHASTLGEAGAYVDWPLLGVSRYRRLPDVLWHDACGPADYHARAKELGLDYDEAAFEVERTHSLNRSMPSMPTT